MSRPRGGRGSITAETAAALPALTLVAGIALWTVSAMTAQLSCVDAARAGARAAARGEAAGVVEGVARRAAPSGARVRLSRDSMETVVEVVAEVPGSPSIGGSPAITVRARAVARTEPGAGNG